MTKTQTKIPTLPIPVEFVERRIYLIRGQKVMLDSDLAELYQVKTFRLNEAVKRNQKRFPKDFMFRLTAKEFESLRLQFVTSSLRSQFAISKRGGRRYLPYVFTEHGVAMLSSVLNSERAVQMNILIIRAFIRLREIMASHKDLAREIEKLKRQQQAHSKNITTLYAILEKMLEPSKIGFADRN